MKAPKPGAFFGLSPLLSDLFRHKNRADSDMKIIMLLTVNNRTDVDNEHAGS